MPHRSAMILLLNSMRGCSRLVRASAIHGCRQVSPQRSTHSLERFTADSPWGASQIPVVKLLSPRRMVTHASQDEGLVRQLVEGSCESASTLTKVARTSHAGARRDGGGGEGSGRVGEGDNDSGDGSHFKSHFNTASSQPGRPPIGEVIMQHGWRESASVRRSAAMVRGHAFKHVA